ncbi:MAG TPA: glycerol-3-phosphate 1-O-acyltransferase PlsY [Rhodanobacter sp.]|nr:glycerol-3-phosphate 1-O-acyltransferase PlsY [Rhodanobacter sp.]
MLILMLTGMAYLLGSLSGSLLLGKLRGVDIRQLGSGNAGGTNALRTQGAWFALGTVLADIGKGVLAAWLAWRWLPLSAQPGASYLCALAAVAGHVWPVFHGFRGGKGAATLVGTLCVLWPASLPLALTVWLLGVTLTGYVGLSTMLAGISVAVLASFTPADHARLVFAIIAMLLLLFTHRANLARLRAGNESRFESMRVLGRLFRR